MYKFSLNDTEVDCKELEKIIYKYACDEACNVLKEILETLDKKLLNERDSKIYRNKGLKKTCFRLFDTVDKIYRNIIQKDVMQTIIYNQPLTASEVNKKGKKGKEYKIHIASIPFSGAAGTLGRKVIKNLCKIKSFGDIGYN